jgi:hypothetical protein
MGRSSADLGQQSAKLRPVGLGSAPHSQNTLRAPQRQDVAGEPLPQWVLEDWPSAEMKAKIADLRRRNERMPA